MLMAKRRFLFFGDYQITAIVCDGCKEPINPDSELIGNMDFSPEIGVQTDRCHYHPNCANGLDHEHKLMTHSSFFLTDFALPAWDRFLVETRSTEELRVLHGFFLDSRSGLLKRVIQCGDCGLVAVLILAATNSEAHLEVIYYKWGSREMRLEAPACSSNLERRVHWCGRPSPEECSHAFVRLGKSGNATADYMAIRKQKSFDLKSGEYDHDLMRFFRVSGEDVTQSAFESEYGFTWDWCSECGLVERLINSPESHLPGSGYASRDHGRPGYVEGHITQTRAIGAAECRIDSLQ